MLSNDSAKLSTLDDEYSNLKLAFVDLAGMGSIHLVRSRNFTRAYQRVRNVNFRKILRTY